MYLHNVCMYIYVHNVCMYVVILSGNTSRSCADMHVVVQKVKEIITYHNVQYLQLSVGLVHCSVCVGLYTWAVIYLLRP